MAQSNENCLTDRRQEHAKDPVTDASPGAAAYHAMGDVAQVDGWIQRRRVGHADAGSAR